MKRRVSSHDVARAAGVSQSTVSLVLSGKKDVRIPDATRERVLAAARELNYRRNAVARTLVTGRTQRIGIVANHPNSFLHRDSYYSHIVQGVMMRVLDANYNLLFHSAQYPHWNTLCEDILSGGTDGVILVGRDYTDELTRALYEVQFPTVCVSYLPDLPKFYAVDCENETGGYLAAQHLLSLGHRYIAHSPTPVVRNSWIRERLAGVHRALTEFGVPLSNLFVLCNLNPFDPPERDIMLQKLLAATPRCTALITFDESCAQALAEALPERGIRVPEDFSIVSFNSTEASARTRPPITSVYQPLVEIAQAAVSLLVELIEDHEVEPGVRRFPVRLDVRASTARCATKDN